MQGRIDVVRPDGLIEGWCWNEDSPESRVSVTVMIDGIDAGSGLAAQYREDLRQAKMGDGFCAFSFVTQTLPSSDKRTQTYTLIETDTRRPVGEPLVVQNKQAISFDNRLIELETRNKLLTARLEEFSQRASQMASAELFAVVGDFFNRLAKDIESGQPLSIDRKLHNIVDAATKAHRAVILPVPERPEMTILVEAGHSLAHTHACLTSLLRARAGVLANVVIIDSGRAQDVALISSVARGIRYIRTVSDLTEEWSEAMRSAGTSLVMMLGGSAVVNEDCLSEIVDGFANNNKAAAIGGHLLKAEASFSGGGLCLVDGMIRDCIKLGHPEAKVDLAGTYPVHALSHQAVAFRYSAVQAAGGLDPAFGDDLGAAVIDLCFRLRHGGWAILAQPSVTIELQTGYDVDGWFPRGVEGASFTADLLRSRWLDSPLPHPPLFIGHAAVLGLPGLIGDELTAVRRLREWGYSVEYFGPENMSGEDLSELRRAGARITALEALGGTLRSCDATIIYAAASSSGLNLIPEGSRVAIGHLALNQIHSFGDGPDRNGEAHELPDEQRPRHVAGL